MRTQAGSCQGCLAVADLGPKPLDQQVSDVVNSLLDRYVSDGAVDSWKLGAADADRKDVLEVVPAPLVFYMQEIYAATSSPTEGMLSKLQCPVEIPYVYSWNFPFTSKHGRGRVLAQERPAWTAPQRAGSPTDSVDGCVGERLGP